MRNNEPNQDTKNESCPKSKKVQINANDNEPKGDGFGPDLARLIAKKNMKVTDIALAMNSNHSTIYRWIHGQTLPTVTMLFRLADVLDTPVSLLLSFVQPSDWSKDGFNRGQKPNEKED